MPPSTIKTPMTDRMAGKNRCNSSGILAFLRRRVLGILDIFNDKYENKIQLRKGEAQTEMLLKSVDSGHSLQPSIHRKSISLSANQSYQVQAQISGYSAPNFSISSFFVCKSLIFFFSSAISLLILRSSVCAVRLARCFEPSCSEMNRSSWLFRTLM